MGFRVEKALGFEEGWGLERTKTFEKSRCKAHLGFRV